MACTMREPPCTMVGVPPPYNPPWCYTRTPALHAGCTLPPRQEGQAMKAPRGIFRKKREAERETGPHNATQDSPTVHRKKLMKANVTKLNPPRTAGHPA